MARNGDRRVTAAAAPSRSGYWVLLATRGFQAKLYAAFLSVGWFCLSVFLSVSASPSLWPQVSSLLFPEEMQEAKKSLTSKEPEGVGREVGAG